MIHAPTLPQPSLVLLLFCLLPAACGSEDDGAGQSCGGLGSLTLKVGAYEGTSSVTKIHRSNPSDDFILFADECTGDATGSLYDIPSAVGSYSFTEPSPSSGSTLFGPNLTLGVPGPDYVVGFDGALDCAPCGSGTITITESDATHVAGVIDATAWKVVASPGHLGAEPNPPLAVSGSFEARWE